MSDRAADGTPAPTLVCGLGHLGFRVVQLLRALGEPVTVVTQASRNDWLHTVRELGCGVVEGDARDVQVLRAAGLAGARALVATTDHDVINIEIALDAQEERPGLAVVLRLFDQSLARELKTALDLRAIFAVSALAAPAFAAAALGEWTLGAFRHQGEPWIAVRVAVDSAPMLAQASVRESLAARHLALVVPGGAPGAGLVAGARATLVGPRAAISALSTGFAPPPRPSRLRRFLRLAADTLRFPYTAFHHAPLRFRAGVIGLGTLILLSTFVFWYGLSLSLVDAFYFLITTVTTTGYGDINLRDASVALKLYGCWVMLLGSAAVAMIYALLTEYLVSERMGEMLGRRRVPKGGHVIVAGLGNLGFRIVEELERGGLAVVGIDRDPDGEFVAGLRRKTAVIIGDARSAETLSHAGAGTARAVIAATGDDAVNLGIGLGTKRLGTEVRSVVRLFDAEFARKARSGLKLNVALSASRIAAPTFAAAALYRGVRCAFVDEQRLFVLLEREAGGEWSGLTPSELARDRGIQVLFRRGAPAGGEDLPLAAEEKLLALVERSLDRTPV